MNFGYVYLLLAIVCEVAATSALKASASFTRPGPSAVVVVGYGVAFYLLSLCMRTVGVGVAYALWSGIGIVLIAAVGVVWYRERLDVGALIGFGLILAGVVVLNLCSGATASH